MGFFSCLLLHVPSLNPVQRISVMAREGQRLMNLHIVTSLIQTAVLTVHRYV